RAVHVIQERDLRIRSRLCEKAAFARCSNARILRGQVRDRILRRHTKANLHKGHCFRVSLRNVFSSLLSMREVGTGYRGEAAEARCTRRIGSARAPEGQSP